MTNQTKNDSLFLSVKEVSELLRVSQTQVQKYCKEKKKYNFPAMKLAHRWIIHKDKLMNWIEQQMQMQN